MGDKGHLRPAAKTRPLERRALADATVIRVGWRITVADAAVADEDDGTAALPFLLPSTSKTVVGGFTATAADGLIPLHCRPSPPLVADSMRGYHILKIEGYSQTKGTPNGEFLKSHPFTVGGYRWCIRYYPNGGRPDAKDYISVFLKLDQSVTTAVTARFKIRFVNNVDEKPTVLEETTSFTSNKSSGYMKFTKREDFEKSKHLKDDSFAIRCDILILNGFHVSLMAEVATPAFISVPPSNLHQHLRDILASERGADVVFEVGNQTVAAHRCVLAARSPVFSAELFGSMKERDTAGVIHVDDMGAEVFKDLLYFVYTDLLPEALREEEDVMLQHLLVAADRYDTTWNG